MIFLGTSAVQTSGCLRVPSRAKPTGYKKMRMAGSVPTPTMAGSRCSNKHHETEFVVDAIGRHVHGIDTKPKMSRWGEIGGGKNQENHSQQ